jgi:cytochrome c
MDHELWTTEAWYTLNAIPEDKPVNFNPNYVAANNQLSEKEKSQGWELLFNGNNLEGIRNYNSQDLGERWVVDNGTLHLKGKTANEDGWQTPNGGDIVIAENPSANYELYLEWKLQKNGNSGIIYNVLEDPSLEFPFLSGPEFQLLDNTGHPDGQIFKHRAGV